MACLKLYLILLMVSSYNCIVPQGAKGLLDLLFSRRSASSPEYHLHHLREIDMFNTCTLVVNLVGKGIDDKFEEPCDKNNPASLTTTHFMILGDPESNALSLYSDTPGTLVVLREGKCTLRTYTIKDDKTIYDSKPMDEQVCNLVKRKMTDEMAKAKKNFYKTQKKTQNKLAQIFPGVFQADDTVISSEEKDPHKNAHPHESVYQKYTSPVKDLSKGKQMSS